MSDTTNNEQDQSLLPNVAPQVACTFLDCTLTFPTQEILNLHLVSFHDMLHSDRNVNNETASPSDPMAVARYDTAHKNTTNCLPCPNPDCCRETFASKWSLDKHLIEYYDLMHNCYLCNKWYVTREELTAHKGAKHPNLIPKKTISSGVAVDKVVESGKKSEEITSDTVLPFNEHDNKGAKASQTEEMLEIPETRMMVLPMRNMPLRKSIEEARSTQMNRPLSSMGILPIRSASRKLETTDVEEEK